MKNLKYILLAFSLLSMLGMSCNSDTPKVTNPYAFDLGSVKEGIYHNDFFHLTIPLPDSFHVQSHEETNQLLNLGLDALSNADDAFKKQLIAASVKNAYLLSAFKYKLGYEGVDFNPSIIVVAENIELVPGIKTGNQYLEHTQTLLTKTTSLDYSFGEKIEELTIGKGNFAYMKGFLEVSGIKITQDYYTIVEKGFALNIIISYLGEADQLYMNNILRKISYGN